MGAFYAFHSLFVWFVDCGTADAAYADGRVDEVRAWSFAPPDPR
jgi:hypothetical protein